jgi:hypothetical protein
LCLNSDVKTQKLREKMQTIKDCISRIQMK